MKTKMIRRTILSTLTVVALGLSISSTPLFAMEEMKMDKGGMVTQGEQMTPDEMNKKGDEMITQGKMMKKKAAMMKKNGGMMKEDKMMKGNGMKENGMDKGVGKMEEMEK